MWKRDEGVRPPGGRETTTPTTATPTPTAPPPSLHSEPTPPPVRTGHRDVVNIGRSVVIKGELSGSEDLTIEGHVEGKIELRENVLTIGANGKIRAQIFAKAVIVLGEVTGNVSATEKVDIRDNGSIEGDIISPRVAIAEGAMFRGSVDMQRTGKPVQPKAIAPNEPKVEAKSPVAAASSTSAGSPVQGSRI